MNTFYLIRHGKTLNNEAGRLSGWVDTPLTPDGLELTQKAIKKLTGVNFDYIYSSDLGRAFITAYVTPQALAPSVAIVPLAGLREVNYGDAGNMPTSEAYALFPLLDRDTDFTPPNGESLKDMQARVIKTIFQINADRTDANILLVAHSGVMAALVAYKEGLDFGQHNISEAYDHDTVLRFTIAGDQIASLQKL